MYVSNHMHIRWMNMHIHVITILPEGGENLSHGGQGYTCMYTYTHVYISCKKCLYRIQDWVDQTASMHLYSRMQLYGCLESRVMRYVYKKNLANVWFFCSYRRTTTSTSNK